MVTFCENPGDSTCSWCMMHAADADDHACVGCLDSFRHLGPPRTPSWRCSWTPCCWAQGRGLHTKNTKNTFDKFHELSRVPRHNLWIFLRNAIKTCDKNWRTRSCGTRVVRGSKLPVMKRTWNGKRVSFLAGLVALIVWWLILTGRASFHDHSNQCTRTMKSINKLIS